MSDRDSDSSRRVFRATLPSLSCNSSEFIVLESEQNKTIPGPGARGEKFIRFEKCRVPLRAELGGRLDWPRCLTKRRVPI
jgi:hypothetical protein